MPRSYQKMGRLRTKLIKEIETTIAPHLSDGDFDATFHFENARPRRFFALPKSKNVDGATIECIVAFSDEGIVEGVGGSVCVTNYYKWMPLADLKLVLGVAKKSLRKYNKV